MIMIMPVATCGALGTTGLIGEITVRLEKSDTEDQRKRNQAPRGSDDPRIGFDFTNFGFYGARNMGFHQIALVRHQPNGRSIRTSQ